MLLVYKMDKIQTHLIHVIAHENYILIDVSHVGYDIVNAHVIRFIYELIFNIIVTYYY